ncbi:HD domain-containing protein [Bacillus sp. Marseille-P3800]|uniref:HD domain-containing protein n=1 Tax=Bacillus sp. Marseille-P3800 TaxID=2014782 RepID=UPI000C07EAE4|nr:HD domain-containing protein [Bacillus sp. Marseille-P3800]
MLIEDVLYGSARVEPVLEKLVRSANVQRLKGVHQAGACFLVQPSWNVTRYDHSIGTMLFVRKLGGSLEEQIVALLHDVSHTAFSHLIDYVMDNKEENHHETIYETLIECSDIPVILEEEGYAWKELLSSKQNGYLLEKSLPHLCGDRIDYTLRDMYEYGKVPLHEAHAFFEQLIVVDQQIVCTQLKWAEWFVQLFFKETVEFFHHPTNVYANQQVAHLISIGLQRNVLSLEDLMKTDHEVMEQLRQSEDLTIKTLLAVFNDSVDKGAYRWIEKHVTIKHRYIDPIVVIDNDLLPASKLSMKVRDIHKQTEQSIDRGVNVFITEGVI